MDFYLHVADMAGNLSISGRRMHAVLANLFPVPETPGSVTVRQLSTGYPSRSVPGVESGPGNDPYEILPPT